MHVKKYGTGAGKWEVFLYVDDYATGKKKLKHKRGFKTKHEAVEWGEQFKLQEASNLNVNFQAFWELYRDDMIQRLRENTFRTASISCRWHLRRSRWRWRLSSAMPLSMQGFRPLRGIIRIGRKH